ncbi:MAG: TolC family protein [Gemmatimonadaceae bacterium]|nr:TolC family protein [Gemmatimonadaceae bacterium]
MAHPSSPHSQRLLAAAVLLLAGLPHAASAQMHVTRADANRAALLAGPRVTLARADTAAARAALITARALPNPSVAATYSQSPPRKHLLLDVPIELPSSRRSRVGAAAATVRAARLRFASERAMATMDVDTTYTMALAAQARLRLSRTTARDAGALRAMTVARRDAGDASDLDVDLATIIAGQQSNVAAADSAMYLSAVLTVQTLMGIGADGATIVLADSLLPAPGDEGRRLIEPDSAARGASRTAGAPMTASAAPGIAAAEATLEAAELAMVRERRNVIGVPSLQAGVEWGDPGSNDQNRALPLIGVSIPLPFLNRNQGPIAVARAERDRAHADLAVTRLLVRQRVIDRLRERSSLRERIARDRDLVIRAERVATRSLVAYREGASALPAVLEARRSAREVMGQYITDTAALLTVESELRALTQSPPPE